MGLARHAGALALIGCTIGAPLAHRSAGLRHVRTVADDTRAQGCGIPGHAFATILLTLLVVGRATITIKGSRVPHDDSLRYRCATILLLAVIYKMPAEQVAALVPLIELAMLR